MAIQTTSNLQSILKNYDAKSWTKSSNTNEIEPLKFDIKKPLESIGAPKQTLSFGEVLAKSIGDVNSLQKEANMAIEKLATGKSKNLSETMLAIERADIAFKQMNQIRLKVVEAYREIMRMQV